MNGWEIPAHLREIIAAMRVAKAAEDAKRVAKVEADLAGLSDADKARYRPVLLRGSTIEIAKEQERIEADKLAERIAKNKAARALEHAEWCKRIELGVGNAPIQVTQFYTELLKVFLVAGMNNQYEKANLRMFLYAPAQLQSLAAYRYSLNYNIDYAMDGIKGAQANFR